MKYLTYLLSALLLVFAAGCNDTEEPLGDPVPPFTLKADRTTVGVGEPVTFTVTSSDGQDVTAGCRICSDINCFLGNTHTWNTAGTYVVEAHYLTDDPANPDGIAAANTVTVTVTGGVTAYTLAADREVVNVGETVVFTVTSSDGRDVTADCRIGSGDETFTGASHAWQKAGNYEVEARYMTDDPEWPDGIPADNTVSVTVLKPSATYRIEADKTVVHVGEPVVFSVMSSEGEDVSTRFTMREPDGDTYLGRTRSYHGVGKYSVEAFLKNKPEVVSENREEITVEEAPFTPDPGRFYRRTLLAEMTATWCWSCHFMIDAIHYCTHDLLYDRALPVAFHEESSEQGNLVPIFNLIMVRYYKQLVANIPAYVLDWNADFCSNSMFANLEVSTPEMVADIRNVQAADAATAGIAVATTLAGRELSVTIHVTAREAQEYWLGAVLVEDRIQGYQHSAPDPFYHMNVGQAMVTAGDQPAEKIGRLEAGQEGTYRYTVTIPEASVTANCRVVAYVCKTSEQTETAPLGYLVSNAVSCPVGESVDYQYEPMVQ